MELLLQRKTESSEWTLGRLFINGELGCLPSSGIYMITSPSGKKYIGQSVNIRSRYNSYHYELSVKKQPAIYNSFRKYGIVNHVFSVIEYCDASLLNQKEMKYIEEHRSLQEGLNSTSGGRNNFIWSDRCIKLLSDSAKARWSRIPKELRNVHKKGIPMSDEQKSKLSMVRKLKGMSLGERNPRAKIVLDLEAGIFYGSLKDAAIAKGINYSKARHEMQGRVKNREINFSYI